MKQRSMDELYLKWYKPVRSWIRKRGNVPRLWIDDIAQEVFVRLLKYDPEIETNLAGYVFRIASNVANEWTERSYIKKPHEPCDREHVDKFGMAASPDDLFEHEELIEQIELAMSQIEGRKLTVLMLHIYENMTYGQIAKELGLTYRIVLRDLTRAYSQLRDIVKASGLAETYIAHLVEDEYGKRARITRSANASLAGPRDSTARVGQYDRIRPRRTTDRRISRSSAVQRLDDSHAEGGRDEYPISA